MSAPNTTKQSLQSPEAALRVLQIICAAMSMGLLTFGVIVAVIGDAEPPADLFADPLPLIGAIFGSVCLAASLFLPGVLTRQAVAKASAIDDAWIAQHLVSTSIVGFALAEGGGLMNLVFWLLTGALVNPIIAGACLFAIIARFPTQGRLDAYRRWCEELHANRATPLH
ncbi:MAG: hypothetical protein C0478_02815 [Planctomyces sp.]|nr:hypothetical protein [Planctomyces sp.]